MTLQDISPCWRYDAVEGFCDTRGEKFFRALERQYVESRRMLEFGYEKPPEIVINHHGFSGHPCDREIYFLVMPSPTYDLVRQIQTYHKHALGLIVDVTADLWNFLKERPNVPKSKLSEEWQWWLSASRPKHLMRLLRIADVVTTAMPSLVEPLIRETSKPVFYLPDLMTDADMRTWSSTFTDIMEVFSHKYNARSAK
jgi:hypothetical protein